MAAKWSSRRGISLMEVLISMFVLAIGLLGVAALIPAGRHEIVEATKLETAAMIGRNAFKEIQTRGYLNPDLNPLNLNPTTGQVGWRDDFTYGNPGTFKYRPDAMRSDGVRVPFAYGANPNSTTQADYDDPTKFSPQLRVVIDPLGLTAPAAPYTNTFPNTATGTAPPPLRRIVPFQPASDAYACFDTIIRSSVDLITTPNTKKDLPPNQQFFNSGGVALRRASDGNYSWMATITSDPSRPAIQGDVDVAVVVFYKRNLGVADEFVSTAVTIPTAILTSGGEAQITLPAGRKPLKPGQWLMLAGQRTLGSYYRWYRVLSAAVPNSTNVQSVTLAGQDWNASGTTHAWLFDNIVNVYEKSMPLEIN